MEEFGLVWYHSKLIFHLQSWKIPKGQMIKAKTQKMGLY